MPLDMTGSARGKSQVHYRRYLGNDGNITVVCVQDFDYPDYDASRFVDLADFPTQQEAEFTPLQPQDVIDTAADNPGDPVVAGQAQRLLVAIGGHWSAS